MRKPLILLLILMISVSARTWSHPVLSYDPATDTVVTMTVNNPNVCNGTNISLDLECTELTENLMFFIEWTSDTVQTQITRLDSTDMSTDLQVNMQCSSSLGSGYYRTIVVSESGFKDTTYWEWITVLNPFVEAVYTGNYSVCLNTSASIHTTTLPSGAGEEFTYQWYEQNSNSEFELLPSKTDSTLTTPALTGNKTYKVNYVSNACPSATGSAIININVLPVIPQPIVTAEETTICYGASATIAIDTMQNWITTQVASIQWDTCSANNNWGTYNTTNETSLSIQLTKSMMFRATVTSMCGDAISSDPVQVIVLNPFVEAVYTDNYTICHNTSASIQMTTPPSGAGEEFTYHWYELNGNTVFEPLPSETAQTFTTPALTDNKTYKVKYESNACPSATDSVIINITVFLPITAGTLNGNQNICYNTETTITLSEPFTGGSGPNDFDYQWQKSTDGNTWEPITSTSNNQLQTDALTANTWFQLTATDNICNVSQSTAPIEITILNNLSAPVIATTTDTICDNMSAIFTIQNQALGGGNDFSYLWQKKNSDDSWTNTVVTVNGSNYSTDLLSENTTFRVIATDEQCGSISSNEVLINVLNDFNRGQLTDTTVCFGDKAIVRFRTAPSGYGNQYNYSWESSTNGNTYTSLGKYGDTLLTNILNNNINYRVSITPKRFCTNRTTYDSVLVSVHTPLTSGTIIGAQTICHNSEPSAIVLASDFTGGSGADNYVYQWHKSTDNSNWTPISSDTIDAILRPGQLAANTWFKLEVTDNICNVTRQTAAVKITVRDSISIPVIAATADTVCVNQGTSFNITTPATGGSNNFAYQWQKKSSNGVWTDTAMAPNNSFYSTNLLNDNTEFRVVANDSLCGSKKSESILITVLNDFSNGVLADTTICHGTAATLHFSTLPTGFGSDYNYEWETSSDGTSYSPVPNSNSNTFTTGSHNENVWYRVAVTPKKYCTDRRIIVDTTQIDVYNALAAGTIEGTDTVCYGTAPAAPVSLSSNFSGGSGQYNYQWLKFSTGGGTPSAIAGATATSYQPSNHTGDTCYQLMITDAVCGTSLASNLITIYAYDSVHAPVLSSTTTAPICFGTAPEIINVTNKATGGNGEFNYQWQRTDANNQWINLNDDDSNSYQPDTLQADAQFRLFASTGCGSKYSLPVQINVYPQMEVGTLDGDTTICHSQNATLYFATPTTGGGDSYTYYWERANSNGYETFDSTDVATLPLAALTSSSNYRVRVKSDLGCGTDTTNYIFIKVWNALTPPVLPNNAEVCSGSSITLNALTPANGGDENYSYVWQQSNNPPAKANDNAPKDGNTVPPYTYNANIASGNVYFQVICTNGCGVATSNTLTVKVNPLPDVPTLYGDTTIHCTNQSNLEYWVDYDPNLYYLWSMPDASNGELLSVDDSSAVLIHWFEGVTEASLALNLQYQSTGCKIDVIYDNIHIDTANHAPNKTHIAIKKGAGILICEDNTPDAHYLWGMIEKSTGIETTIENSDCRYIQLPNPIDTARYDYFVDIWYGKGPCITRTYYLRDERNDDWWSGNDASMNVHPNPSYGEVYYSITEDIKENYQINVYNTVGHLVYTQQCDSYSKDTHQRLNKTLDKGTYIMSIVTSNGVLTQKIIVK